MPVPDYYNRVNPDLLALLPPDAKAVLEIGCGAGALCEAYRRINPGVEWIGVDVNAEALSIAETRGVETLKTDLNECLPVLGWSHDVVILGDVLEHCIDPWNVLKWCEAHAAPGAQVLACIPNIQHWTVIRDLLAGHWRYTDEGLLDRTHLRFFTLESIREMFEGAGLQVFEVRGRDICNEGIRDWVDSMWPEDTLDPIHPEWRAYQYIVRSMKPIETQFIKSTKELPSCTVSEIGTEVVPIVALHIHAVTDGTICDRLRIHEPFAMLGTIPGVRCTTARRFAENIQPPVTSENRIFLQQRLRSIPWEVQAEVAQHWIIIAEIDDDPAALKGMGDQDFAPLRAVHAIQCSTEVVAETCRQWNPNVMVFENQIADLPPWEDKRHQGVRIFFGALNRESDWAPIIPALNRVLTDHPGIFIEVVHDRLFHDALKTKVKIFTPFCPWHEYRKILRRCDIALLPLEPTRFNEHKSDLKFLECAAEGVAVLASETVYSDPIVVEHKFHSVDERGFLYDSPERFERMLGRLIESPQDRISIAQKAYAYVRDHRLLSQHYRKRHAWYLDLIARRAHLNQQLLARCPELVHSSDAPVGQPALLVP